MQSDFVYGNPAHDAHKAALNVSIFADRAHVRDQLCDDAAAAGFRIAAIEGVAALLHDDARPLGDVVLLDCPAIDGAGLAALAQLDLRAANSGARLIVSTSFAALDDVFGCLEQCSPELLVDPTHAERVLALARVRATLPDPRVRDLSEADRLVLLRLTEQVGQLAQRLDRLDAPDRTSGESGFAPAFRFESPRRAFSGADDAIADAGDRLVRAARPALPDPRLLRQIIRQRQLRARYFDGDLFADPAWDMLLDLTAARAEHIRVSITSLCIASGVPPTTALRWIGQLVEAGLLVRVEDESDRRRAFITLSDKSADAMARYFAELGSGARHLV